MSASPKRIDPSIIAAFIGVCGTVLVALISIFANRLIPDNPQPQQTLTFPTWTASPGVTPSTVTFTPIPTDTVMPGEPSSTPAPPTFTPEPTFTAAPPAVGSDWANGCISMLWRPYPETVQPPIVNGCLSEPVNLFFAADGRLAFLVSDRYPDTQVYGMFAPLPTSGTASVKAFLRNLQDGEIWMGVFAEPNIESQGMVIVIPPGDVSNRVLVQKTMPGQVEIQQTQQFAQNPPLYDVVFEFGNGAVRTLILRDTVFDAVPVASAQQWLFVGYQVKKGNNRIDAEFLDLVITGQ